MKSLYVTSWILVSVGFLGMAAYFFVVNFGPVDGGANIGLGILSLFCVFAGAVGLLLGIVAIIISASSRQKVH